MLKLLIVDDEYNIREGLKNAVEWSRIGVTVVGTAADGAEALSLCERHRPDILITDIYMDGMSGLELIEALAANGLDVKCVLISGHDDFAYARRAIDLKVYRYLLKPIVTSEILAVVDSLGREILDEREFQGKVGQLKKEIELNRDALSRQFIRDLLFGQAGDVEEVLRRSALLCLGLEPSFVYRCAVLELDGPHSGEIAPPVANATLTKLGIARILEEESCQTPVRLILMDDEGRTHLVLGARDAQELDLVLLRTLSRKLC